MDRYEAGKDADRVHAEAPAEGADAGAQDGNTTQEDVRQHSQQAAEGEDDNDNVSDGGEGQEPVADSPKG